MHQPIALRHAAICLALLVIAGCTPLHKLIVEPQRPNARSLAQIDRLHTGIEARAERFTTPDGLELAYVMLEPRNHGLERTYESLGDWFSTGFTTGEPGPMQTPRGTVVLLHGWSMDSTPMLVWAMGLAEL